MQILELCLYGKNGEKRTLAFRPGRVNIITGKSKSGKSAVGDIIEYCLGGDSCPIAAGVVRDSVNWYGLLLKVHENRVFVARKSPAAGLQSTSACYFEVGEQLSSPNEAPSTPNTNTAGVEQLLTSQVGIIENVHTPDVGESRLPLQANIRHALFYCFLSQDEIASRSSLFHRQAEGFGVTNAIRDTLPYFLGAVDEEALSLATELRNKNRELRLLKRELADAESLGKADLASAAALVAEAEAAGLICETRLMDNADFKSLYAVLKAVELDVQGASPDLDERLSSLQEQLLQKQQELAAVRAGIDEARVFMVAASGYSGEMAHQKMRLSSIGLFENLDLAADRCPLCSGRLNPEPPSIAMMKQSIRDLDGAINSAERERPQLRRFIDAQERVSTGIKDEISMLKAEINGIYSQMKDDAAIRDISSRKAKVFGRISYWLDNVRPLEELTNRRLRISQLEQRISEITDIIGNDAVADRVANALSRIQYDMTDWARELDMEYAGSPYRLDMKKVTVVADAARPVQLRDMGSASNWLGSHLLAVFGLHKFFVENSRPVPGFLFLDQPSQAYFPAGSTDDEDLDVVAVARTYEFIRKCVSELDGGLQAIVVDHAALDDDEFRSEVVEDWRAPDANLIPKSWCTELMVNSDVIVERPVDEPIVDSSLEKTRGRFAVNDEWSAVSGDYQQRGIDDGASAY